MGSKVTGVGMFAPPKVLSNAELESIVATSDSWITERTGIRERRIAAPGTPTSDLSFEAARRALDDAGVSPEQLDLIVVATITGDMPFPSTACFLQTRLGASRAFALDVNAACSGFLYALSMADAQIRAGRARRALVVGAEILSSVTDYTDRSTCILFGDGAGAAVLSACPDGDGILDCSLHSDGNLWELIYCPGGGTANPYSAETEAQRLHFLRMNGNDTFKHAVTRMVEVSTAVLERNGIPGDRVALFIPHQANMRIINAVGKRLSIPDDRVFVNLERYGNTSAASIPIALAEAREQARYKKGDYVLLTAFGAGLTWGSVLMRM